MFKKVILFGLTLIVAVAVLGGLYFWNQVSWPASSSVASQTFTVAAYQGAKEIGKKLQDAKLIRSAYWFRMYVYFDQSEANFFAGDYQLQPSMSIREITSVLTTKEKSSDRTIRIIEGWTKADIAEYLQKQTIVDDQAFLDAAATTDSRTLIAGKTYAFLADKPATQGLEGYLFPDTYQILPNATAADIIEKMLDNFEVRFTEEMKTAAAARNMSVYEIVTLASIIEKEVKTSDDRRIAAGIFYNRLREGIALQSDATVNYVTGKGTIQPSAEDVSVDDPYNTYKYTGLPPGPISNPSLDALEAAVNPQQSDYYYFLTKPDGSTVFSKTYEEHLSNKQKYLQ